MVARNVAFDRACLAAKEGTRTTITFTNQDAGVNHAIVILPAPFGYNTPPKALFFGEIIQGVRTVQYDVPPLPAGLHTLVCFVHHDVMFGFFAVPPAVSPARGTLRTRIHVVWSPGPPPAGFVFDVQVQRPGGAFGAWLTATTSQDGLFTPDRGVGPYAFRVSLYKPVDGPLGYSPPTAVTVSP